MLKRSHEEVTQPMDDNQSDNNDDYSPKSNVRIVHASGSNSGETPCKSHFQISPELLKLLGKYEQKRAAERVILIPDPKDVTQEQWLAYHPDNPSVRTKPAGLYAFTTHLGKSNPEHPKGKKIAAWTIQSHRDTFHVGLSEFSPAVAYAGEVLFYKGHLEHFDNGSGNYDPAEKLKNQSGFPEKKFKKVTYSK